MTSGELISHRKESSFIEYTQKEKTINLYVEHQLKFSQHLLGAYYTWSPGLGTERQRDRDTFKELAVVRG